VGEGIIILKEEATEEAVEATEEVEEEETFRFRIRVRWPRSYNQHLVQYSCPVRNRLHVEHFVWQDEQNQSVPSARSQDPQSAFSAADASNGEEGGDGK
jgi:hypothetical protein